MTRAKSRGYIHALAFQCRECQYRRFARLWIDQRDPEVLHHSQLPGGRVLPDDWKLAWLECPLCPTRILVERASVVEFLRHRMERFDADTFELPVWRDEPSTHFFPATLLASSHEDVSRVSNVAAGTVEHRPEASTEVLTPQ